MKMKRIGTILLALLMLISFMACNLDNSGILSKGPNRTPSDNKNRNYIGHDTSTGTIYFVTSDGLSQAKLNGTSLTDDEVISSDSIFQHYFQGHGWFDNNSNSIVWLEDNQGEQIYHLISFDGNGGLSISPLTVTYKDGSTALSNAKYLYRYYSKDDTPYLVVKAADDSNAAVYTPTVDATSKTLTLAQVLSLGKEYSGSVNGLLWNSVTTTDSEGEETTTTTYSYALPGESSQSVVTVKFSHEVTNDETTSTEEVTVYPSTIKSVYEKDGYLFVVTSSSSQITIYTNYVANGGGTGVAEGETLTLDEIASVSASYNSSFPIYVDFVNKKLIFLDYNISDSSVMYFVDLNEEDETASDSLSSGIEAEAFIQFPSQSNELFMMTKNQGFYKVDLSGNSVSEV